ncbi:MAG: S1/P1 nuclease [Bacteriovoracaceae bacterium]|nr:S1/P1 nuclease [Bacteriovoracaceae bacterium]
MKKISLVLTIFLSFSSYQSFAWGPEGHKIVGEVAQKYLSPAAKAKVAVMLKNKTLADEANWADSIKSNPEWDYTRTWHYVNIADNANYGDAPLNPAGDVVEAIGRLHKELMDKNLAEEKRIEALKFLVHFVGDIHQPLHAGRGEDRGGNDTEVNWDGVTKNLHYIWDTVLIEMKNKTYKQYAADLINTFGNNIKEYQQSDILIWVKDDMGCRDLIYKIKNKETGTGVSSHRNDNRVERDSGGGQGQKFSQIYAARVMPTLDLQLFKAGVRLANLLNQSL